jgi:hypothetical protein
MPQHLEKLCEAQLDFGADVVYFMPYIPQLATRAGIDPSRMRDPPVPAGVKRSQVPSASSRSCALLKAPTCTGVG